jgi:hypothetical protein
MKKVVEVFNFIQTAISVSAQHQCYLLGRSSYSSRPASAGLSFCDWDSPARLRPRRQVWLALASRIASMYSVTRVVIYLLTLSRLVGTLLLVLFG